MKVKVCHSRKCIKALALPNTGFETPVPMVSLPIGSAEKLDLEVISSVEFEDPGQKHITMHL